MRGIDRRAFQPAAFIRHYMDKRGLRLVFNMPERADELFYVVTVERSVITDAHRLEYLIGEHELFQKPLALVEQVQHAVAEYRHCRHGAFYLVFEPRVLLTYAQARKIIAHRADVPAYGHLIVVEHYYHGQSLAAYRVERFIRHAAGERAVAYDRNHSALLTFHARRLGKPERDR